MGSTSQPQKQDQVISLEEEAPVEAPKSNAKLVALYGILFLVSAVGNSIFSVKSAKAVMNYPLVFSQLTSFIYTPVFLSAVMFSYARGQITEEMKRFASWKYLLMGILEGGGGALYIVGLTKSPGSISVVLQQLGIPLTLVCAFLLLRVRFHSLQYIGSLVIVAGVVTFKSAGDGPSGTTQNDPFFNFLLLLGVLAQVVSSVYKEIAFKGVELDVNLVQYYVAYFQFFVGIACLPLQTLPIFEEGDRINFAELPNMMYDGCMCIFRGVDSKINDECGPAGLYVATYLLFNIFYNAFAMLLIKHASATFVQILSAVRLPLAQLLFYSSFVMGEDKQGFSPFHVYGLAVILSGIGLYRYGGFRQASKMSVEEVIAGDLMNPADGGVTQSFLQSEVKQKGSFVASFVGGDAHGEQTENLLRKRG